MCGEKAQLKSCFTWCPCSWRCWTKHKAWKRDRSPQCVVGSRVPLASLVAFVMCCGGAVAFSVGLNQALHSLVILLQLEILRTISWVVMVFHVLVASYFLLIASLCTGTTRHQLHLSCSYVNLVSRCAQAGCMTLAYILHLVWLFLPAVLLIPVGILTATHILCQLLPHCLTLSDYGIDPDLVDRYHPEKLMQHVQDFNESVLLDYADMAEDFLLTTIDHIEDSPILDNIITQIESYIPDEAEAERFITNLLNTFDLSQLISLLGKAEKGVDFIDRIMEMINNIPDMSSYMDKFIAMRPNLLDVLDNDTISAVHSEMDSYLNYSENTINKTLQELDNISEQLHQDNQGSGEDILPVSNETYTQSAESSDQDGSGSGSQFKSIKRRDLQNMTDTIASLPNLPNFDLKTLNITESDLDQFIKQLSGKAQELSTDQTRKLQSMLSDSSGVLPKLLELFSTIKESKGEALNIQNTLFSMREMYPGDFQNIFKIMLIVGNSTDFPTVFQGLPEIQDIMNNMQAIFAGSVGMYLNTAGDFIQNLSANLLQEAESTAKQLIQQARGIAEKAERAAQNAVQEAEVALRKAEALSRQAVEEIDVQARALAMDLAEKAKWAAEAAKVEASKAIQRAQVALEEADEIITAAAMGAFTWARQAMGKLRYYAKQAFSGARRAVIEARKGARIAVEYVGVAKREFLKVYDYAKQLYRKLRIQRYGRDTFCSDFKVLFCIEIRKSHVCMIIVFVSSIIINLSMVHFLMAMAANYVYLLLEEEEESGKAVTMETSHPTLEDHYTHPMLTFSTLDTGSLEIFN